jgi:hypothetical protein
MKKHPLTGIRMLQRKGREESSAKQKSCVEVRDTESLGQRPDRVHKLNLSTDVLVLRNVASVLRTGENGRLKYRKLELEIRIAAVLSVLGQSKQKSSTTLKRPKTTDRRRY